MGYRGSSRDVTEEVEARDRLHAAMAQAEHANRAKTQFLSSMSHELRTPLNAILGFSDMMRMEIRGPLGSDAYRGYAQDIHDSGEHLLQLINDLLDLSKIEAGKMDLHRTDIELEPALHATVRLMQPRAAAAHVALSLAAEEDMRGNFDERAIRQVVLNLLSNAIKFTPAGGSVRLSAREAGDAGYVLEVSDNGIGIPPEDQEKVFRPFEQAGQDLQSDVKGTGLGLPICKALVESHGGRIELDSAPGKGTTIRVHLPADGGVQIPVAAAAA